MRLARSALAARTVSEARGHVDRLGGLKRSQTEAREIEELKSALAALEESERERVEEERRRRAEEEARLAEGRRRERERAESEERGLGLARSDRTLVERALASRGFEVGEVDGEFDSATRAAVRDDQRRRGLPETGYLTRPQYEALIELLRPRWAVGQEFREPGCPECPLMVVVPSGSYEMGSPSHETVRADDEVPVHRVRIPEPFAVGVYEVTFAEWDACRRGGGCTHDPGDVGWGRGGRPVMNVSWSDAKEYVRWLSGETGAGYRLLSESEWEYVARAGTSSRYWWGDGIGDNRANCDGCGSRWDNEETSPVGSFSANGFGLHDVHGNVWEWVEDCWHADYAGAPSDGSVWTTGGDCVRRVLRGGSWSYRPRALRSANRLRLASGDRDYFVGFRLARTLD